MPFIEIAAIVGAAVLFPLGFKIGWNWMDGILTRAEERRARRMKNITPKKPPQGGFFISEE